MFFIKAETQGFGFFVAGKPCAGGMVEENLRLFSISLFVVFRSSFFALSVFPVLSFFPFFFSLSRFAFFLFLLYFFCLVLCV